MYEYVFLYRMNVSYECASYQFYQSALVADLFDSYTHVALSPSNLPARDLFCKLPFT